MSTKKTTPTPASGSSAAIRALRPEYRKRAELTERAAGHNPLALFTRWLEDALAAQVPEPQAMTLATADTRGRPSARIVFLRGFDARGFFFYSNYASRKGRELKTNPYAALTLFWPELQRQVRIEGRVKFARATESDDYFASRPRDSQISSWASPQSQIIPHRAWLERMTAAVAREYASQQNVSRPPNWGGYVLTPASVEFWQGRQSRLHDRLLFKKTARGWQRARLAP